MLLKRNIYFIYAKNRHIPKWKWRTVNGALQGKKCSKDLKSIQSSTTPDPGYHLGT